MEENESGKPMPRPAPNIRSVKAEKKRGKQAASAVAEAMQAEVKSEEERLVADEFAGVVHYIQCQLCRGPGIFIFGDPRAAITDAQWESSYHARGDQWFDRAPFCQLCFDQRKHEETLRVFINTNSDGRVLSWTPNPRFLRKIPRHRYEELVPQED